MCVCFVGLLYQAGGSALILLNHGVVPVLMKGHEKVQEKKHGMAHFCMLKKSVLFGTLLEQCSNGNTHVALSNKPH